MKRKGIGEEDRIKGNEKRMNEMKREEIGEVDRIKGNGKKMNGMKREGEGKILRGKVLRIVILFIIYCDQMYHGYIY